MISIDEIIKNIINSGVTTPHEMKVTDGRYTVYFRVIDESKDKMYRDPLWLHKAYLEEGRTMQNIGAEFGISPAAVNQWLVKHGIPTRERGHKRIE